MGTQSTTPNKSLTRRILLGALAALPVPLAGVERVRYRPQAGDVITGPTGPSGTRVEVQEVLTQTLSDGSQIQMVYYNKVHPVLGAFALIATREQWRNMSDWDQARPA